MRFRVTGQDNNDNRYYVVLEEGKVSLFGRNGMSHTLANICSGDCMPLRFELEDAQTPGDMVHSLKQHSRLKNIEVLTT